MDTLAVLLDCHLRRHEFDTQEAFFAYCAEQHGDEGRRVARSILKNETAEAKLEYRKTMARASAIRTQIEVARRARDNATRKSAASAIRGGKGGKKALGIKAKSMGKAVRGSDDGTEQDD
jgi:hypothetical protein